MSSPSVIEDEFLARILPFQPISRISCHNLAVLCPTPQKNCVVSGADKALQSKWIPLPLIPTLKKKPKRERLAKFVFGRRRQLPPRPTLTRPGAPGSRSHKSPPTGQTDKNTLRYFGTIELYGCSLLYHFQTVQRPRPIHRCICVKGRFGRSSIPRKILSDPRTIASFTTRTARCGPVFSNHRLNIVKVLHTSRLFFHSFQCAWSESGTMLVYMAPTIAIFATQDELRFGIDFTFPAFSKFQHGARFYLRPYK